MESEPAGIFRVKLFAKNIALESSGTYFMHMRVNERNVRFHTSGKLRK